MHPGKTWFEKPASWSGRQRGPCFLDTIEEMPLSIQEELAEALKEEKKQGGRQTGQGI